VTAPERRWVALVCLGLFGAGAASGVWFTLGWLGLLPWQ
jgi:hypothetical protein